MQVEIGFGKTTLMLDIPANNPTQVLKPNEVQFGLTGAAEVKRALENPIDSPRVGQIVKANEKIAIITSDITRPLPSKTVLPPLLDELYAAGIRREDIVIVFGLGSHRPHTEAEMRYLVGDAVFETVSCIDLDTHNCVPIGHTRFGTRVDVFRPVVEADRRICLGNIEFHYFAGYSGGAKAIMPGVCTHDAIQQNHSQMVKPEARAGAIDDNPVRQDIDDVLNLISIDFIVNVVLDEKKQIVNAVAGHPITAHRVGCAFLDTLYKCEIPKQADLVVVSPGGYPKDINMYQAQKALDNARHAVRKGGIILWVASAKEGLGEPCFERWMTEYKPAFMVEEIARNFELGGHKAAAIAMVLQNARIFLVSDLDAEFVKAVNLEPFADAQPALNEALTILGKNASVIVMPYGGSTLPFVKS
ncbi:MAG: nickel-dependent lactate racemase [Eubacteriales bacterium]|nr:nickel-dependent lactate racemase [Eubacteriales bacterium]